MPRGGKRKGAGRKHGSALDYRSRFRIGQRCEVLWREAWTTNTEKEAARRTTHVRKEWEKIQIIPVPDRKAWLKSQTAKDYQDDVKWALREDHAKEKYDRRKTPRGLHVSGKRPYGKKNSILRKVAREFKEYGVRESVVEKCWDEYRRFEGILRDKSS
jgi:hypothetical protein